MIHLAAASLVLLFVVPAAMAQTVPLHSLEVDVEAASDAGVTHVMPGSEEATLLPLVRGNATGITVRDEIGNDIYHTLENHTVSIAPSESEVTVRYVVRDALTREGNMWVWDFSYPGSTRFAFAGEIDTIYTNQIPVYLGGGESVRCHGCQMRLEFTLDEPLWNYDIVWGDHTFVVAVRSHDTIGPVTLNQPSMSIDFEVERGGEMVTAIIPLQMLGDPYQAYLDGEGVWYHEYRSNGTHAWVNMRPPNPGVITLVGSSVIPEFPVTSIVMAAASAPLLGLLIHRRIHTSRSPTRLSGNRTGNTLWYS
jgi:hypothetical protein